MEKKIELYEDIEFLTALDEACEYIARRCEECDNCDKCAFTIFTENDGEVCLGSLLGEAWRRTFNKIDDKGGHTRFQ